MLLLLILISSTAYMGIDDKTQFNKKETDIPTGHIRPTYTDGVKTTLAGIVQWNQLLFENFESGSIPADWTVLDGNSDSHMWNIYNTSTWHSDAMPADSGQHIVAYDDNAIGFSTSSSEEELILPALSSMDYDSIALIYSFGYQEYSGLDTFAVRVRTCEGASWGTWNNLVLYYSDMGSGVWDTLSLAPFLPADSLQIEFNWWDHHPTHWDLYVAVDNIEIRGGVWTPRIDFSADSLLSPPALCRKDTPYDVLVAFSNKGMIDTMVDLHVDIYLEGIPVFSGASMGALIKADSTKVIDFGSFSFFDYGTIEYTAYITSPFDSIPANDTLTGTGEVSPWEIVTNMPENLMDHAVVFDGNDIFVIGGCLTGVVATKAVHKYSPGGIWSLCDSMPIDLRMYDACVLGDTIYVPGGYSTSAGAIIDTLLKYSISGDKWTSGPGTGEDAWFYVCGAANGKIYKIGGYDNVSTLFSSTWEYDPSTGSWTKKTDMPLATELAASWVRNDSIYIAGGVDPSPTTYYNQTQIYDAVGDTWIMDSTFFAYLPRSRWGAGSAIYRDTLFIMGGVDAGSISGSVLYYAFDGSNTWNPYPSLITSVYRTDGVAVEGLGYGFDGLYLFGGSVGGFTPISSVQARIMYPAVVEEHHEKVKAEYLSLPGNLSFNKISFSYNGNKAADITVRDIAGRVVREYTKVEPGSSLNFGDELSSGIYFISVKGTTECKKAVLIR